MSLSRPSIRPGSLLAFAGVLVVTTLGSIPADARVGPSDGPLPTVRGATGGSARAAAQATAEAQAQATATATATASYQAPGFAARVPAGTTQVVRTVRTRRWCSKVYCTKTQAWRKVDGRWRIVVRGDGTRAVFRSAIGPNGFAPYGERREGDGRTPTGVYRIAVTFSTTVENPGHMPWRRRLPTSNVTNYHNHLYNTWIEEAGRTDGDRPSMRYGFWVGYNNPRLEVGVGPKPVIGKGSGIFYHTSRPGQEWSPTEGCTNVGSPAAMSWIVRWLRPQAKPRVVNNR